MSGTFFSMLALCSAILFLSVLAATDQQMCELQPELGDNMTVPLEYDNFSPSYELTWKHNTHKIFEKKKGKVGRGKEGDINAKGDLVLHSVQMSQEGQYIGELYDNNGKQVATKTLCVTVKPSKPSFKCESNWVTLSCNVMTPKEEAKVLKNKEEMKSRSEKIQAIKPEDQFFCSVSYQGRQKKSDPLKVVCPSGSQELLLFGLDFWLMVMILAGGGGLLVLLLLVMIVCICRHRKQSANRLRDEEELRLANVTPQHKLQPPPGHHRQHAPHCGQPPPGPHAHNGDGQTPVPPRSRGKRPKPPPVPTAEEEEEEQPPPPRPRPRQATPRHNRS